jgi:hypothetical protein
MKRAENDKRTSPPPGGGGGKRPGGDDSPQGPYAALAADLAGAIPAALKDGADAADGAARLHALLAGRDDYAEFCRWLAGNGGTKRMIAAAALYAGGDITSRADPLKWAGSLVPGKAGEIYKNDVRLIAQALQPVWEASGYPGQPSQASSDHREAVPS